MLNGEERFFLVKNDVLPEAMKKTIEVKELLEGGRAKTIHEAVNTVGLSRSAYYKYKDSVYPFQALVKEKIITLFFHLEDHPGTLSELLAAVSRHGCNILTIHQTIPIHGKANVTLSLDIAMLKTEVDHMIKQLGRIDFVKNVELLSSGA